MTNYSFSVHSDLRSPRIDQEGESKRVHFLLEDDCILHQFCQCDLELRTARLYGHVYGDTDNDILTLGKS